MPIHFSDLVLAAGVVSGCYCAQPYYCPGANPNNNCLDIEAGPRPCTTSAECSAPSPVCDVGTMACVQCTAAEDSECTGTTPVCGADHACRACAAHSECGAHACLPDGSCGDNSSVAYVDPAGTDNPFCTSEAPCTRLHRALAAGRPYVKIAGTIDEMVTVSGGRDVTFLGAPGAKLTTNQSGNGPILTVRDNGTSLRIYDLSIEASLISGGVGIWIPTMSGSPSVTLTRTKVLNNPAAGIWAEGGGAVEVTQSVFFGNEGGAIVIANGGALTVTQSVFFKNKGGGIAVLDGTFKVVGNVFNNNGTLMTVVGGIRAITTRGSNRLEFNTFYNNQADSSFGPAIHCDYPMIAARNNILSYNGLTSQIGGNCTHSYSIVRPGALPSGPGNSSADPLFVSEATGDFHLREGSPAQRAADPRSDLTGLAERDLDGHKRTSPADIGADEVP